MLERLTITFMPPDMAERIAKANNDDDPDWSYEVRDDSDRPGLVRVAVVDEDGIELGSL